MDAIDILGGIPSLYLSKNDIQENMLIEHNGKILRVTLLIDSYDCSGCYCNKAPQWWGYELCATLCHSNTIFVDVNIS